MTRGNSPDSGPPGSPGLPGPPDLSSGTLVRSRVASDPADPLAAALDRELTGYAVFEPRDALLLDDDGAGVIAFEDGVPRFAYHTATGAGGSGALADLAAPGPYDVELRELPVDDLEAVAHPDRRMPPGMAAERLAGDPALAERTRAATPSEWEADAQQSDADGSLDAVEAFLEDEEKVAAIRDRAREEAKERAERWGLDAELK